VPERKKWFVYDGWVWRPDIGDLKVSELCKRLADALMMYALSIKDDKQRTDYMAHVSRWQRRAYRETIIKDSASVYPVEFAEFDKNPMVFNCLNGTLNLETGVFSPHKAGDMLSKIAGVNYDPNAKAERWERFIGEVMQGNQDNATFLQKALGYAVTGDTRFECFFILYGPSSRNGKGTTMETFARMMGDYGKAAKPDTIGQKQTPNGSGPSEDVARLVGARFVNISEPDKKLVLSTALVKTLTGNDTITARFLHENSFEYRPQFKLFINTNHLPAVTDVTLFSSGRVKVIPFERHFTEAEQDKSLKAELAQAENMSGLLNWCLHGLWLIKETGFDAPDDVLTAVDDYRRASDKIGRFLDEEFEADPLGETRTEEAYNRYKVWCSINGHYPENMANFKSSLSNYAMIQRKRPAGSSREDGKLTLLIGYRLRSEFEPQNSTIYN
jgi:putative DNA primase/helicase